MRHAKSASRPAPLSVPPPVVPTTIGDVLTHAGRQRAEATALIDGSHACSWQALDIASDQLACGLVGLSLQRGDCIAILARNQLDWVVLFHAAAKIGVAVLGLDLQADNDVLHTRLADAKARVVFTLATHAGCDMVTRLHRMAPHLPRLRHVIPMDGGGLNSLQALAATPLEAGRLSALRRRVLADDVAVLSPAGRAAADTANPMASDTAGIARAATRLTALTHRGLLAAASAQARHTRVSANDVLHLAQPLHLVDALCCGVLTHLVGGGTVVLVPDAAPAPMLALLQQHRPTLLAGWPALLAQWLAHPRSAAVDLSSVRLVLCGGAHADAKLLQHLAHRLPHAVTMNLYALAETAGAALMTDWDQTTDELLTALGKPLDGVRLKVTGVNGEVLPADTVGMLWVQAAVVAAVGAHPDQPTGTFPHAGWLQTGDLGTVDVHGVVRLRGRQADTGPARH